MVFARFNLKAAELVAFEVLNPTLRSRGTADKAGSRLLKEKNFYSKMHVLFEGNPTGSVEFVTLTEAMKRIDELEGRIEKLETQFSKIKK